MGTQRFLGEFEQVVLLAVLQLGENASGRAIHEEIEDRGRRTVALTAVYVTLTRLENKGLVSSAKRAPDGGRLRKHFEVEPAGIEALQRSRDQLDRFWEGVRLDAGDGA